MANIKNALGRIEETDDIMAGFLGIRAKSKRKRRFWSELGSFFQGLGNGIGAVASVFTGSSKQPDMSYYDQEISALRNGQKDIVNRINMQTTLFMADAEKKNVKIEWLEKTQDGISKTLQTLKTNMSADSNEKTRRINELIGMLNETNKRLVQQDKLQKVMSKKVDIIENKLSGVENKLNNLYETVSEQAKILNETNLNIELNSITIDLKFIFDEFQNEQKKLFYVIKRAKRGELDPYVLSPINLVEMLQGIIPKMQENERFPFFPNIENAHYLYNLITPEIYFENYKLFFILKIPLVNIKSFDFYKITSLPVQAKPKVFAFVLPRDPFLLIDKYSQEYSTMSNDQFENFCKDIGNLYLCKQYQPLSSVHYEAICEVSLLMTSRTIPKSCNKRLMYLDDLLFLQLQKSNSWVYLSPEENSLIVNCNSNRNEVIIQGSGFITLSSGSCEMKHNIFKIENIITFAKPVETNYTSSANLINFIRSTDINNVQQRVERNHKPVILPFDLKILSDISVPIENSSNLMNYLYLLLLLPIVAVVIVLFIYQKQNKIFLMKWVRNNPAGDDIQGQDKMKLKFKTNNETDNISALSIRATPSEADPDSEYLTVRVKVKNNLKNRITSMIRRNNHATIANEYNASAPPVPYLSQNSKNMNSDIIDFDEDAKYGNHGIIVQDKYLKELRKMKPRK